MNLAIGLVLRILGFFRKAKKTTITISPKLKKLG
jgi:hypothetical protein